LAGSPPGRCSTGSANLSNFIVAGSESRGSRAAAEVDASTSIVVNKARTIAEVCLLLFM
jgi:hypothetical protein